MKYLQQFVTTSLNVGGGIDASQTTGIVLQSLNNIDETKPSVACLTWADPLNTSVAEWVTYTSVNSTTNELQGVTRGAEGYSAKTHENTAVVAFPLSKAHVNELNDLLTSGSGAITATIDDDTMATATDTSLATSESIKAYVDSGTVTMTNKTLTSPVLQGDVDGWTASTDTWVYASASTFTISGVDRTAIYTKGTRLKFTQTTVKYAVVVSSAFSTNTTVTIAVNNDYTIANAAISANYYSYQASPQGYPGWFNYSPSYTGFSSAPPDPIRYYIIGTKITLDTGGCGGGVSNANSYTISSPVTIATGYWTGFGGVYDNSSWQAMCGFLEATSSSSTTVINARKNAYSINNWTASGNKALYGQITYGF